METLLQHEPFIRLGAFVSLLTLMALLETRFPARPRKLPRVFRWSNNWALIGAGTLLMRALAPAGAVGIGLFAELQGVGLLQWLQLPGWLALVLAVTALDLTMWAQHRLFHAVPLLWRVHRMHHSDLDFDVTTGLRFHPLEMALSFGIKAAVILAIGAPAMAVLIFEVLLSSLALFNHANIRLPASVEAPLRKLIVTPDFHRVHHSWLPAETNSNYGFNLSIWDRLFGTYVAQPSRGHRGLTTAQMLDGTERSDMKTLAEMTATADKVLVF